MLTRRNFIKSTGLLAAGTLLAGFPRLTFADLPTDNRFILVILRGALDGLAAVPPYADKSYAEQRKGLAFAMPGEPDGALDLNGFFGLHPSLEPLLVHFQTGQMAIIHAAATPYRERSHFDAQNLLENGTTKPGGDTGWLNRALVAMGGNATSAIAMNQQVPLVLQGELQAASWAPKKNQKNNENFMEKISALYKNDAALGPAFAEAMRADALVKNALPEEDLLSAGKAQGVDHLYGAARAAAIFLTQENGPRVAVLEAGGWDTHANQGTANGQLANRLADLGQGLSALPELLRPVWRKTVIIVVTEFGRTVAENGTKGTDHGTGSAVFLMGGNINGGKVYGQWPGLDSGNLYQGRDLMPTTDMRSIFKTILYAHLNAPKDKLENTIFPGSGDAAIFKGIVG